MAHSHDAHEETLYGLEGVLTLTVDGERHEVGRGDVLCIRRGAVHKFENEGDVDARQLLSRRRRGRRRLGGLPDPAAIGAVMRRHGLTPAT